MVRYAIRRCVYALPTLFLILTLHFFVIQWAPGGPVESMLERFNSPSHTLKTPFHASNSNLEMFIPSLPSVPLYYRGAEGLDEITRAQLTTRFGFDQPLWQRYISTIKDFFFFQFGDSFFKSESVTQLIWHRLPASLSLALLGTLVLYMISVPFGIIKAYRPGSAFDILSNVVISLGYALPAFLIASLLILVFAGGNYFSIFPLRGLISANFEQLSFIEKILDYFWHLTLPVLALAAGGFSTLTLLSKNAFLEEIQKSYVITARAKGLNEFQILIRHIFRNAAVILVGNFSTLFIPLFFGGTVLIEIVFSLPGLGWLGYEAILQRDYPLIFGTLYIFTFIGLLIAILNDIMLSFIDPRIHFEAT